MWAFSSKQKMVLLFATLGVAVLFFFQNCSSGLYQIATSVSAEAKSSKPRTDFDDLLRQSERELDHTQKAMKSTNELNVATPTVGSYDETGSVTAKNKGMKIKLVKKTAKKKRTYALNKKASAQSKKVSLNQKSSKSLKSKKAMNISKSSKKSKIAKNEKLQNKSLSKKAPQRTPAKVSSKKLKADAKSLKKKKKKKKKVVPEDLKN